MELPIILVFIGMVACVAIYMIARRGFVGALLGGKVIKTYGEVTSSGVVSSRIRIHKLLKNNQNKAVIEVVFTSFGSFQSSPVELDREELEQLRDLLSSAASEV